MMRSRFKVVLLAWPLLALVAGTSPALGQNLGGGGGAAFGGGGGDRGNNTGGNEKAEIVAYRPAKEGGDAVVGTLSVKTESGKRLSLDVRTKENLTISVGNHNITAEEYEKVLLPGLMATVGWTVSKSGTRTTHVLSSMSLDAIDVEGNIRGVSEDESDVLSVFGKPANNQDWPAMKRPTPPPRESKKPPRPGGGSGDSGRSHKPPKAPPPPRPKQVANKALRLKFLEGVSTLTDSGNTALAVADLREYKGSGISAKIVYGKRLSLIVSAQMQGERQESSGDATAKGGGEGRQ